MTRPQVFADTETTSLAWDREAWEVALIRRDGVSTVATRFFLPVDLSKADPTALRIGGYYHRHPHGKWVTDMGTEEDPYEFSFSNGPDFDGKTLLYPDHAARIIQRWTHDATIVGAQPHFDVHIFERLLHRAKLVPSWHHRLVDVESLTAGHHHQPIGGLAACAESLGIPFPKDEQHTAMGDARVAMAIYDKIICTCGHQHTGPDLGGICVGCACGGTS